MRGPTRRARALVLAEVGGILFAAAAARAHDFWIEPSSFHPAVASRLAVSLRVGQDFRGDPVPRDDRRIVRFLALSAKGERPVEGWPAMDPAGFVTVDQPGLVEIGYRSGRSPVVLEPEKFEKYLAEEGLESILAAREARNAHGQPGREVFSRCAKSLVLAGGTGAGESDRPLGFTLELVAEIPPDRLSGAGAAKLPVRLLYEGKPLSGALVVAMNQATPEKKLAARSDAAGRVAFALRETGVWLVKAVHMIPAPPDTGADWESLWASLTFEVP